MSARMVLVGRLAVVLALTSVTLHVVATFDLPLALALGMLVAAAACLSCVPALWRGGSVMTWSMAAGVNVAMLVVHGVAMSSMTTSSSSSSGMAGMADMSAHDHAAAHASGAGWDLMHVASVVAGAEVLLALGALATLAVAALRRRREVLAPA
ncbi:hypothetical protein [Nocardioides bruguierae]|uniref:hypothetical protein n=1 Tax=Nocardioides bruguierae TaxID=2945102 RepID=UPI002021335C|nr:hypothetical protein [Nocardioides bruguierae]MCL8026797.1 hypothetical protein [Nocardioides bruguierae]